MKSLKRNYEMALAALEGLLDDAPVDDDFYFDDPNDFLAEEAQETDRTPPQPVRLPLDEVLEEYDRLPPGALFLGAAYDELPILLNLNDPTPGPILIAGDAGCGKTDLLKMVGDSIEQIHTPQEVQFGIITNSPAEWRGFDENKNCMGIFPAYERSADDFIRTLADWAHKNRHDKRFALLLIDDIEAVLKMDEDVRQDLRWLLLRGPNRRVWPLVTLDVARQAQVRPWLDAFRTRLFGSVKNLRSAESILPMRGADLHLLEPGKDFVLYENRQWVKFWVPLVN